MLQDMWTVSLGFLKHLKDFNFFHPVISLENFLQQFNQLFTDLSFFPSYLNY